jgi:Fe-S-cluster containining protein
VATWKSRSGKKRKASKSSKDGAPLLAALGTPPTADEVPLMLEARAKALDALGFRLQPKELVEAFKRTSEQADAVRLRVLQATQEKPACSKGCSFCCSHKVGVTVPEVLAIVEYLEASPERLAVVRERVAELAKNPLIFSDSGKPRARIPCALLEEDGSCEVYEVRPIPCRSWLSTDVESCKQHLDEAAEAKMVVGVVRSGNFIHLGLVKVMDDIQRFPYLVELTAGLDIALNVPGAIESWLAGEPVFERATAARREEA